MEYCDSKLPNIIFIEGDLEKLRIDRGGKFPE